MVTRSRRSMLRTLLGLMALLLLAIVVAPAAWGVTINVVYDNTNSIEPGTDPGGTLLTNLVQSAASRWTDILEDSHSMTINIRWDTNAATMGGAAIAPIITENANGTRTLEGDIVFNNTTNWFFDPTPLVNEEFAMGQTLFRDLSNADQTTMYNFSFAQPLLESAFSGAALPTAPLQAQNGLDLLSVAFHELGHHLGVTNQLTGADDEWMTDNDYDFAPNLIGGRVMAARTGDAFGHLAGDVTAPITINSLLQPALPNGVRRLPSATDVFATAAASNWTRIDLPRQDFLIGTSWSTPGNWAGNQVPGAADDVSIRGEFNSLFSTGDVQLDQSDLIANLLVGTSSNLRTGANRLDVAGTTTIDFDGTFPFSQIVVEAGGELETGDLVVSGGELELEGGLADVNGDVTVTKNLTGGNIAGFGTVSVAQDLLNDGSIISSGGNLLVSVEGTLRNDGEIVANSGNIVFGNFSGNYDLDGMTSQGVLRAVGGNIEVLAPSSPNFNGQMHIDAGRRININTDWRLLQSGVIEFDGSAANDALLTGGDIRFSGTINVEGRGKIDANTEFEANTVVNLEDANAQLQIGDGGRTATIQRGDFLGKGEIFLAADTVNVTGGKFDIGHFRIGATTTATINGGGSLGPNIITTDFTKEVGGTLNLNGGNLTITGGLGAFNSTFNYGGTSQNDQPTVRVIDGAQVTYGFAWRMGHAVDEFGALEVSGFDAQGRSSLTFTGGGAGADVVVGLNGVGDMQIAAGALVSAGDDIVVGQNNLTKSIATVSGVAGGFRTTLQAVNGNASDNDLFVGGAGTGFVGNGELNINNGALVEVSGGIRLADKPGSIGVINIGGAQGGFDAELTAPGGFNIGTITSTPGGTATVNINTGGAVSVGRAQLGGVDGRLNINGGQTTIGAELLVRTGGVVNLQAGSLRAETIDHSLGGEFNFTGGTLTFETFDGDLVNEGGVIAPGNSSGSSSILGNYDQPEGVLEIELGGLLAGSEFDVVDVAGKAGLSGALDVSLIDGFQPSEGDTFEILNAAGGLAGTFFTTDLPTLTAGLNWNVLYGTNNVVLEVLAALATDTEPDGDVDGTDFLVLQGDNPSLIPNWRTEYGSTASLSTAQPVPEPTGLWLLLTMIAIHSNRSFAQKREGR